MRFLLLAYSSKLFGILRSRIAKHTDLRLRLLHELLNGIMLIKTFAWERPFGKPVSDARVLEMVGMKKKGMLYGLMLGLYQVSPKLALFGTLVTYILQGNQLDAETVREMFDCLIVDYMICLLVYRPL